MMDILGFLEATQIYLGEVTALVEEQGHDIYQCPQASKNHDFKPRDKTYLHPLSTVTVMVQWENSSLGWSNILLGGAKIHRRHGRRKQAG